MEAAGMNRNGKKVEANGQINSLVLFYILHSFLFIINSSGYSAAAVAVVNSKSRRRRLIISSPRFALCPTFCHNETIH